MRRERDREREWGERNRESKRKRERGKDYLRFGIRAESREGGRGHAGETEERQTAEGQKQ